VVTEQAPLDKVKRALEADGENTQDHPLLRPSSCHTETIITYAPAGATVAGETIPMDGTHIASGVLGLAPTSRGRIQLASADPRDAPVIDPNYYATETDRVVMRAGIRQAMKVLLVSPHMQDVVESETPPQGFPPLNSQSSDQEIDERVKHIGNTLYHYGGGMPMGKAVDSQLKVYGVQNLRVADASVLPVSITAHYQAPLYALAERAADIILS
jgi:choline dehydrogenase-like flavoprotein